MAALPFVTRRRSSGSAVGCDTMQSRSVDRTYGAGLARHLASAGVKVVEVNRPEKLDRYLDGKDDFIDAEAAAACGVVWSSISDPEVR